MTLILPTLTTYLPYHSVSITGLDSIDSIVIPLFLSSKEAMADTVSEESRTLPNESTAGASDRILSLTELLRTPEPFNIDSLEDVDQEIDRLETLAAKYHDLNQNERFRTRVERLINQREQLTLLDALEESLDQNPPLTSNSPLIIHSPRISHPA